ncbi:cytidine deaminase [Parabacteroides sp. ZJ-118]|uniref:cytidine deaminase n=1 Tax=Parabacteroides sp. ZJ-118 TaxID=2709398 RepID=UPI0013E9B98B|nr:cytidine deaminase [Parabacteroides sp. ZJ-118]
MKALRLETRVELFEVGELDAVYKRLYEAAFEASRKAYAPYSKFHVGAAVLLENGEILSGNNQENAAYPSGLCAERTTLFYAGARYPDVPVRILAIAAMKDGERVDLITPCGACRQVMLETEQRYGQPMEVLLCGKEVAYLVPGAATLLPFCFGKSDLIR